ncbi:MAG: hypothetical protein QG597_2870 [Actinomycetota bacterium]|nr:hypothetical protein [Actinomycetota bacterium]
MGDDVIRIRRHSTLGYISPEQWETQYTQNHPSRDRQAA